jgi:hypothetical protein
MKKCANTKLMIKIETYDNIEERLKYYMKFLHVDKERLIIIQKIDDDEYIQLFSKIDILLDTFPYSGTTTSCNALYNSIPIISLYNENYHVHNVTSSILINSGLPELVAKDEENYITIACNLINDSNRINEYKKNIRNQFMNLMEPIAFMKTYEEELTKLTTELDQLKQLDIDAELVGHRELALYNQRKKDHADLDKSILRTESDISREQKQLVKLEKELATLKEFKCHTCGQEFHDDKHTNVLTEKTKVLDETAANIAELQELLAQLITAKEEIGPVSREHREEIWNKFSDLTKQIHDKREVFFESLRATELENLEKKKEIIDKIEVLATEKVNAHSQWLAQVEKVEALRTAFFSAGKVPSEVNEETWAAFKTAVRNFNSFKNSFYKDIKKDQNSNLTRKITLVAKAKELQESTDFAVTTPIMKKIQEEWRQIGHVPRKYSDKIWAEFKEACNHYFDKLKEQKNEEKGQQQVRTRFY